MTEALGIASPAAWTGGGFAGDNVEMTNLECGSRQTQKISNSFP